MSDVSQIGEFAKQVIYFPELSWRMAAYPVMGALGALAIRHDLNQAEKASEDAAMDFQDNDALLEKTVKDVETEVGVGQTVVNNTKRRVGPLARIVGGLSLTIGAAIASPVIETTSTVVHGNAIVLAESTDSMATRDMSLGSSGHESRFKPVVQGLENSNFGGTLTVDQFGGSFFEAISSGPLDDSAVSELQATPTNVDPTQSDVVNALSKAAYQLPFADSGKDKGKRVGEIDLISDGDAVSSENVTETASDIVPEIKKLEAKGIDVNVIVPGTTNATISSPLGGHYVFDAESQSFEGVNSVQATANGEAAAKDLDADLAKAESKPITSRGDKASYLLYLPGAALLIDGVIRLRKRTLGKVLS